MRAARARKTKTKVEAAWAARLAATRLVVAAAGRTCGESAPPAPAEPDQPSPHEMREWLVEHELLPDPQLTEEACKRRYLAFSKCSFGGGVGAAARKRLMKALLPWEHRLAASQFDIGCVTDPAYHYELKLNNPTPIKAKPLKVRPEEEAWLD